MKIYSAPLSMFGAKAEIAAHEKGIAFELEFVPFTIAKRYEPKHPEVVRINAKQQVPVLIDGDLEIFDSTQIFEYFEDIKPAPALWPRDLKTRARARLLELKSDEVFFPNVITVIASLVGTVDAAVVQAATDAIHGYYGDMEKVLTDRNFLAGEFSYADIAFFMAQLFASIARQPIPEQCARLTAWRKRIAERENVRRVAGKMISYLRNNGIQSPALDAQFVQPPA